MHRRSTLHDVARKVGLSKTTVSNILAQRGSYSIETRQRVHQGVVDLRYRPNARSTIMRAPYVPVLGIVIPQDLKSAHGGEPCWACFAASFVDRAAQLRTLVTITTEENLDLMVTAVVDALGFPGELTNLELFERCPIPVGLPVFSTAPMNHPGVVLVPKRRTNNAPAHLDARAWAEVMFQATF